MSEQKIEKQKIAKGHIFKSNFWSTIKGPDILRNPGNEIMFLFGLLHIAALPITLPFGAGIKSLIDINTRHAIPLDKIEEFKKSITRIDVASFDAFIEKILSYHPKSNSSNELIKKLHEAKTQEKQAIGSFRFQKKQEIREEKLKQLIQNTDPDILKALDIQIDPSSTLSESDTQKVNEAVENSKLEFAEKRRASQREAIISYIDNHINAGKKLQNIMVEQMNDQMSKIKP